MYTATKECRLFELNIYTTGRNYLMGVGVLKVLCLRRASIEKNKLINYEFFDSARTQVLSDGIE
jgi:hypothetical protein